MPETITMKRVLDEIRELKNEVIFIKKHMFDPDTIMTTEEARRFEQSLQELREGRTTPLSALKKELGI